MFVQVWLSVHQMPMEVNPWIVHTVCWGVPLVVSLLPFTTNMYGKFDDDDSWCFITDTSTSPSWGALFWELCSFYVWLWLAVIINCALIVKVILRLKTLNSVENDLIKFQIQRLFLYPFVAIFCWMPTTIMDIIFITSRSGYGMYVCVIGLKLTLLLTF